MTTDPKNPLGFTHPTADIHPSVVIGDHTKVWAFVGILPNAVLGRHVSVGRRSEIGCGTTIGDGTRIGYNVFIPNHAKIGKDVFIGPSVTFCDDMHPRIRRTWEPPYHAQPPVIEDGAAIGAGVVVLPGIHIGKGAKIAAGSVVTKDVGDYVTVRGGKAAHPVEGPREWDTEMLADTNEAQYLARKATL